MRDKATVPSPPPTSLVSSVGSSMGLASLRSGVQLSHALVQHAARLVAPAPASPSSGAANAVTRASEARAKLRERARALLASAGPSTLLSPLPAPLPHQQLRRLWRSMDSRAVGSKQAYSLMFAIANNSGTRTRSYEEASLAQLAEHALSKRKVRSSTLL